jgi:hypothetical protein
MSPAKEPARTQPPVVAELGRPETPQEAADRKAESSQRRREGQTLFNLVLALVASLGVVLLIVLVVVRPDPPARAPVDYRSIAAEAGATVPLAVPALPAGWIANSAVYDASPADGVASWYIGFITPGEQFVALRQGVDANPTWVASQLGGRLATGTTTIASTEWNVYDHRDAKDVGNLAYGLAATGSGSDYVLFGTASEDEFEVIAKAIEPFVAADR